MHPAAALGEPCDPTRLISGLRRPPRDSGVPRAVHRHPGSPPPAAEAAAAAGSWPHARSGGQRREAAGCPWGTAPAIRGLASGRDLESQVSLTPRSPASRQPGKAASSSPNVFCRCTRSARNGPQNDRSVGTSGRKAKLEDRTQGHHVGWADGARDPQFAQGSRPLVSESHFYVKRKPPSAGSQATPGELRQPGRKPDRLFGPGSLSMSLSFHLLNPRTQKACTVRHLTRERRL